MITYLKWLIQLYWNTTMKPEGKLLSALENNEELSTVPNLIYKSDDEIHMTSYKANRKNYVPIFQTQHSISDLANVHLQPYNMCYWNKCTFCGINKKYHFNNDDSTENALETSLNYLIEHLHKEKEIKYIWFIDEAIHPHKLKYIADFFIQNKI